MLNKKQLELFSKSEKEVAPEGKAGELMAVNFRFKYNEAEKRISEIMEGVTLTVHFPAFGHEKLNVKISADDVNINEMKKLQARCELGEEIPVRFNELKVSLYTMNTGAGFTMGITATAKGVYEEEIL